MIRVYQTRGDNVAYVEINGIHIGWVRKFGRGDWRGKLDDETEYPAAGHATRRDAAGALAARTGATC